MAGEGHWITGTVMIIAVHGCGLLFSERLFRIVRPKLLTLPWFTRLWNWIVFGRGKPVSIRKIIYTTNAVEALNQSLRKIIKTRGSFPNDEAALKLLYLAIRNGGMRWRRAIEWTKAMGQSAIKFGDRFPPSAN